MFEGKQGSRPCTSISITGGKGGVGKTSIAIKTCQELGKRGLKTLLIDCDYNLSDTLVKLKIPVNNSNTIYQKSIKNLQSLVSKQKHFDFLHGCQGDIGLIDDKLNIGGKIIEIMKILQHSYDFIILDCPPGLDPDILKINAFCAQRFVIITPDSSSLTDSYSLIKVLNKIYGINENHIIVNKVHSLAQYQRVVVTLSETIESFLGCRTIILGMIQKHLGPSFENIFLQDKNSIPHKNILKVLNTYTESFL